jgi:DNA repair exonuclease SbcCD ATPase subunit
MDIEKFKQELDELFLLFNRLMEKQDADMENIPGINKMMVEQFKVFFTNYESMKDQIAYQLQGQFGDSIQEMVETLIKQLREELGEEDWMIAPDTEVPVIHEIKKNVTEPEKEIAEIDKLLQDPNLTPEQVDELLDRRSRLR